jgi:hypothetical protein
MDAARWEQNTGELLNNSDHAGQKTSDYTTALEKWIKKTLV